jgi:hypothetical protein
MVEIRHWIGPHAALDELNEAMKKETCGCDLGVRHIEDRAGYVLWCKKHGTVRVGISYQWCYERGINDKTIFKGDGRHSYLNMVLVGV